jgi:uncharacterized DUF497 family protein
MSRERDDRLDIRGIVFEWYPPKAEINLKKHKVSFQEASTIFGDKRLWEAPDLEHSGEEFRYIGIGQSEGGRVLLVNFTVRSEKIRIISAREAEAWEKREYEIAKRDE